MSRFPVPVRVQVSPGDNPVVHRGWGWVVSLRVLLPGSYSGPELSLKTVVQLIRYGAHGDRSYLTLTPVSSLPVPPFPLHFSLFLPLSLFFSPELH